MKEVVAGFVPVPERGILTRDDLDQMCHFELDEFHNAYLASHATDKADGTGLYLVSVNPDGVRKASKDWLYVWHPRAVARALVERYELSEEEPEVSLRKFAQLLKDGRLVGHRCLVKQAETHALRVENLRKERDESMAERQFRLEEERIKKEC